MTLFRGVRFTSAESPFAEYSDSADAANLEGPDAYGQNLARERVELGGDHTTGSCIVRFVLVFWGIPKDFSCEMFDCSILGSPDNCELMERQSYIAPAQRLCFATIQHYTQTQKLMLIPSPAPPFLLQQPLFDQVCYHVRLMLVRLH